jgi:hypothetical protein
MAFQWPECWTAAGKWLESFLGVMWCWWCAWQGLREGGAPGRRQDREATELELTGAVVRAAWARGMELDCSVSFSGLRRCCRSNGLRVWGGGGG